MDSNSTTFLKSFCRTCMNGNEENEEIEGKTISIFSDAEVMECKNTTIMELLMLTTPELNIDSGDMLPKVVCESCLESLLNAYKFQKMCIRVEQILREMIKEIHAQSQTNENPRNVVSSNNISVYCPNGLTKTSKVNRTFIDQNAMTFCDGIVIADSEGIKFKMEKRRSMDISHNDFLVKADRDMDEWEISSNKARSEKCNEIMNIDAAFTKEQRISKIIKDCTNNSKTVNNAINSQNRKFKCDECGNRFSTRSSMNQHKTIHLRTVGLSQENILGVTEEGRNINIECEDTKIINMGKETQTNNGAEESSRNDRSDSGGSDDIDSDLYEYGISSNNANCQIDNEIVKNKDDPATKDQNISEITKDSTNNLKTINNAMNIQKKNFKCDKCGNCFSTRFRLNQHKTIHLRTVSVGQENIYSIKFQCDGKKIEDIIEKEKQTYVVTIGMEGTIIYNKKVDHRKSSGNSKYEYRRVGQKTFCESSALTTRQGIHTGKMPYLCPKCGKAFTRSYDLKIHLLRHGTQRPYECPVCPKTFYSPSNLITHKVVHSKEKEKSHVCNICGAAFVQAVLLKKHSILHGNEKKYKCDYCDKRFFFNQSCQTHMRIHTGEKPYKCRYCEKAYCQGRKLTDHLRVHLGDNKVYQCRLCPLRFPTAKIGREHFITHKNDDEETKVRNLSKLNALIVRGTFFK